MKRLAGQCFEEPCIPRQENLTRSIWREPDHDLCGQRYQIRSGSRRMLLVELAVQSRVLDGSEVAGCWMSRKTVGVSYTLGNQRKNGRGRHICHRML